MKQGRGSGCGLEDFLAFPFSPPSSRTRRGVGSPSHQCAGTTAGTNPAHSTSVCTWTLLARPGFSSLPQASPSPTRAPGPPLKATAESRVPHHRPRDHGLQCPGQQSARGSPSAFTPSPELLRKETRDGQEEGEEPTSRGTGSSRVLPIRVAGTCALPFLWVGLGFTACRHLTPAGAHPGPHPASLPGAVFTEMVARP